jgi:hypothetical protein
MIDAIMRLERQRELAQSARLDALWRAANGDKSAAQAADRFAQNLRETSAKELAVLRAWR